MIIGIWREGRARGQGGGSCCYLLSDEPLSAGDVITQHHLEANPVFLEHFILQTKEDFCTTVRRGIQ